MESYAQEKQLRILISSMISKSWIWIGSTILFTLAALFFAITKTDKWEASQALLIRDEAVGSYNNNGRFDSTDSLKAAQEMVVEVARSTEVLRDALIQVGPVETLSQEKLTNWPSQETINDLKGAVTVESPHGTEFGTTEVVYLRVIAKTKERAVALTDAINNHLEASLKVIRNQRSSSIFTELKNAVDLANSDLETATAKLEVIEKQVGSDLGALRSLNESFSGDSILQKDLNEIKNRIRTAEAEKETLQEQLAFLNSALSDPEQLIATPNRLLQSQSALQRLKEGLVDAQLRTSELLGRMDDKHPLVKAAQESEKEVQNSLRKELTLAVQGVKADQRVNETLLSSLENQEAQLQTRMEKLAGIRARYSNALTEVEKCNSVYEQAYQELSDARAAQASSSSASLLTKFNDPVAGNSPLGPGRSIIVLAGTLGGLAFGLGLIVAITPLEQKFGRRKSDRQGRRASDRTQAENPSQQASFVDRRVAPEKAENSVEPVSTEGSSAVVPLGPAVVDLQLSDPLQCYR